MKNIETSRASTASSPLRQPSDSTGTPQRSEARESSTQKHDESVLSALPARRSAETRIDARPRGKLLPAQQMQLGAYLLGKSATDQKIEGMHLDRIVCGNEALHAARLALSEGRGNVNLDLKMSDGETAYTTAATHMFRSSKRLGNAPSTLAAMHTVAKTGNCSHHADVSIHALGDQLGKGDEVRHVRNSEINHNWAEWRGADGPTVVLDAWAEGSAIHAEDGHFSSGPAETVYAFGPRLAAKSAEKMASQIEQAGELLPQQLTQFSQALRRRGQFPEKTIWAPTAVIGQAFADRVATALAAKTPLLNEMHATKIARELGASVADAATSAPQLVHAAMHLTRTPQNPPRSQSESDFQSGLTAGELNAIKAAHSPQDLKLSGAVEN